MNVAEIIQRNRMVVDLARRLIEDGSSQVGARALCPDDYTATITLKDMAGHMLLNYPVRFRVSVVTSWEPVVLESEADDVRQNHP